MLVTILLVVLILALFGGGGFIGAGDGTYPYRNGSWGIGGVLIVVLLVVVLLGHRF